MPPAFGGEIVVEVGSKAGAAVLERIPSEYRANTERIPQRQATIIGCVEQGMGNPGVRVRTIGGMRDLDMLSGEQLPRIC